MFKLNSISMISDYVFQNKLLYDSNKLQRQTSSIGTFNNLLKTSYFDVSLQNVNFPEIYYYLSRLIDYI